MTARQSYHLTFARFSPSLSVRSFSASEAVNTAYSVEITATSTDSSLPLSSYLNQRAAFEIRPQEGLLSEVAGAFGSALDDSPAKQWQGIITSCEKLSVSKDETVYRFVLEPRFAALKHFQTSRLFQYQTVPDIVAAVFKHHGFSGVDYRFQKSRNYTVREYVTQYLESDFDFINRLCEEEGIWYAFEQHEQHGDVVVFGDSPEHYLRSQGLPVSYRPHAGLESVGINQKADGHYLNVAVRLLGNQFFVFLFGLAVLHAQHGRLAGTVQISIQHTYTRAHPRHGHRQVGSGGGFTHAAFARGHGDDIFHAFNGRPAGLHFVRGNFGGDLDMQPVCLFM